MRECRNLPIAISVAGTEIHSKSNAHFPFFASRSIFLDWPHIWISFSSLSQYLSPSVRFGLVRLVCVFFCFAFSYLGGNERAHYEIVSNNNCA